MPNYKRTVLGCNLAMVMQAFVINCTSILFVALRELYNFSYAELGSLVFINFLTQIIVDFTLAKPVDKYGFRPFLLATPILVALGTIVFIVSPFILTKPFIGFAIGTIIFAGAGGILEVIVSPIIDNLPQENKEKAMSLAHSFYGFGQIGVVIITSVLLYFLGNKNWMFVMVAWLILPIIVFCVFFKAPLINSADAKRTMPLKKYLFQPFFIVCFITTISNGASETIMAQWSSTFMQNSLQLPKLVGDILGVATFAFALSMGRFFHGKFGGKISLSKLCMCGAALSTVCYLTVALVDIKPLAVIACMVSGLGVSLLWPATLVMASKRYTMASAWLFALLSGGGDIGAALGPLLTGFTADGISAVDTPIISGFTNEQIGLKAGLLVGALFSVVCLCLHITLYIMNNKDNKNSLPLSKQKDIISN